jgi:hypothetical protein
MYASDLTLPTASAVFWEDCGATIMLGGVGMAAKRPEHLSSQPASFAQLPFPCLSQCCPCGQQSIWAEAIEVWDGSKCTFAPATGSMATARAMKAKRMARIVLMADI